MTVRNTILVIDDNAVIRKANRAIAKQFGFETFEAASGTEGFELFQRYQDVIQLIIIDFEMPGLNGAETIAKIRAHSPIGQKIPVILNTAISEEKLFALGHGHLNFAYVDKNHGLEGLKAGLYSCLKK